jgi:hypothetical protein
MIRGRCCGRTYESHAMPILMTLSRLGVVKDIRYKILSMCEIRCRCPGCEAHFICSQCMPNIAFDYCYFCITQRHFCYRCKTKKRISDCRQCQKCRKNVCFDSCMKNYRICKKCFVKTRYYFKCDQCETRTENYTLFCKCGSIATLVDPDFEEKLLQLPAEIEIRGLPDKWVVCDRADHIDRTLTLRSCTTGNFRRFYLSDIKHL